MTHPGRVGGLIATVLVALAVVVPGFTPDPLAMADLAGGTLPPVQCAPARNRPVLA